MSETDVAEAMLTLSFTRQATRTKSKPRQCLQKEQTMKAKARNISETSSGQTIDQGWDCEEAVGNYRKWIADQVTVADYGWLGKGVEFLSVFRD